MKCRPAAKYWGYYFYLRSQAELKNLFITSTKSDVLQHFLTHLVLLVEIETKGITCHIHEHRRIDKLEIVAVKKHNLQPFVLAGEEGCVQHPFGCKNCMDDENCETVGSILVFMTINENGFP
jgi:hypothetical protein